MNYAAAKGILAQRMNVDRATWTHAQQTALWLLDRGEAGDDMADPHAELVDIESDDGGPVVLDDDERDDYIEDLADVGARFGCDGGTYYVETASGPGWIGRR